MSDVTSRDRRKLEQLFGRGYDLDVLNRTYGEFFEGHLGRASTALNTTAAAIPKLAKRLRHALRRGADLNLWVNDTGP